MKKKSNKKRDIQEFSKKRKPLSPKKAKLVLGGAGEDEGEIPISVPDDLPEDE